MSIEARDFITKLLVYKWDERMDVHSALRHPWLERADKMFTDEYRISTTYLRDYWSLYRYARLEVLGLAKIIGIVIIE